MIQTAILISHPFIHSVFDDLPWMKTISLFLPGAPGRVKYARRRYARRRTVF